MYKNECDLINFFLTYLDNLQQFKNFPKATNYLDFIT